MKSFLEYVAEDLLQKYGTNLAHIAVVFPNKRASLFLNEHLARLAGQPLWSPAYITISDLFRSHSTLSVADPIKLICDLHRCFVDCTGINETLDHFYGWGQLLLSDFDDIDKNMAPAEHVFANLRDIHEYDDSSYLTPEQREIIRKFFRNFSDDHPTELKRRFLQLWSHIGNIYQHYNSLLTNQGLAYEGALYRKVALDEEIEFEYDTYIFVGFNLLQQVEQTLFRRLRQQGKARFYWDFDHAYIDKNEAGYYISQYLEYFPNELNNTATDLYDNFNRAKEVTFISAPTENIQARYISSWLDSQRIADGKRTAIVLADESLLQTVIHCLPDEAKKVNITTGYPLAQTAIASLVTQLINLQTLGYSKKTQAFRQRYLNLVLRHPYGRFLENLLTPIRESDIPTFHRILLDWLLTIIRHIANQTAFQLPLSCVPSVTNEKNMSVTFHESPLNAEALFKIYTLLNRLKGLDLPIETSTLQRLITQLIKSTTIPFHGEPAEGLQVMGFLETRNLDFDHVLILSCNEGNIPKGVNNTSFIPYSIRKAYGLTTADHKVAIYAYYFYRLLQRTRDVTLVYNNATNDGKTGEMSRFMLHMMVESRHPITFRTLQAGQQPALRRPVAINKTSEVMTILRERLKLLTPSAINRYMRCQLSFFYYYISNLEELDENEEDIIDNRIFGNIFHLAAQLLYKRLTSQSCVITKEDINRFLDTEVDIYRAVDDAIREQLKHNDLNGLQLINRQVIIHYLRQLLEIDRRLAPFTILGLEHLVKTPYIVRSTGDKLDIGGTIDRLDLITTPDGSERIRVIDYKTGSHRLKAMPDVEAIFAPESLKDHSDYYLQTLLYSQIVHQTFSRNLPVSPALLFIQHAGTDDYDPTLCLGKEPINDISVIAEPFMTHLDAVIADIFTPTTAFVPAEDRNRCRHCPYIALCGIQTNK
jgi:hypothetical protein